MKIKRDLYKKVKKHLLKPEITLIIGPRQVGKTTLIIELYEYLKRKGHKTIMLNMDFEEDFMLFKTQAKFVNYLKFEFGKKGGYVFIDEIQRKKNAGKFFKGIYDMKLPYKFIFTGSGSVELKANISESLVGRKRLFEMSPVSLKEFIDYKTNYNYSDRINKFILKKDSKVKQLFNEYMSFGGYPRIILATTLIEKKNEMREIYQSYLEKDIVYFLNIRKTEAFTKLLILLASEIGNKININELSNTLGLDTKTINNYLWYLEKTYIIKIVRPYFTNMRKELTKTPIYYFVDLGLRNYLLYRFNNISIEIERGHLFENFIFNYLRNAFYSFAPIINYWRTKDGAEVDFVFRIGNNILPVEVKYTKYKNTKIGKSIYNFIAKYNPPKVLIINLTLNKIIAKNKTKIVFIDIYSFLQYKLI